MIEINTYLMGADGSFEPIDTVRHRPADPQHIEGAMELTIDGTPIITLEEWDLIDQLWAYIGEMLNDLRIKGEAETYFPDCAIKFVFRRVAPELVLVSLEYAGVGRSIQVNEVDFVEAFRSAGAHFFDVMLTLFPTNHAYLNIRQQLFSREDPPRARC